MTDLRSALVNNVVFGSLTVRFGLHSHLLQNSPSLFQLVDTYVEYQQSNDFAITEEVLHSCFRAILFKIKRALQIHLVTSSACQTKSTVALNLKKNIKSVVHLQEIQPE